jgi:hypothetical protein
MYYLLLNEVRIASVLMSVNQKVMEGVKYFTLPMLAPFFRREVRLAKRAHTESHPLAAAAESTPINSSLIETIQQRLTQEKKSRRAHFPASRKSLSN